MRKRIWFACLLAMSMTFAACGSKASTEVEQEDAATVQEDTPEAEEDTTQEEENTDTITPEESQEQTEEVQNPTVTETPEWNFRDSRQIKKLREHPMVVLFWRFLQPVKVQRLPRHL